VDEVITTSRASKTVARLAQGTGSAAPGKASNRAPTPAMPAMLFDSFIVIQSKTWLAHSFPQLIT
jgi:hypothetical protein